MLEDRTKATHGRATTLYILAAFVSLIGLADAIYLTVQHVTGESVRCTIVSGCSEVLSSPYATVRGIPLALVGATAYFTVFSLATLAAFSYQAVGKVLAIVVGLKAFVIGHFCQFCLLSAAVTIALALLVAVASRRSEARA